MATSDLSATTTITFEQLTKYFHLPINDVAKELGICATMLKKICRKNGIPRWPHRKIKSLNKMIENLEASLQNNASEAEECIRQEINILKNKKSLIMKNPSILVQGGNKRVAMEGDGKVVKRLRTDDDMPQATVTVPRSASSSSSSSAMLSAASSSLSINQLLTPSNPFSTPLTSYLLAGADDRDRDEKDSPREVASPSSQHYYKSSVQQSSLQQASRYYIPQEYSHRAVDYLTSPSYVQQPQTPSASQDSHYVLPKLNFTSNATQPTTSFLSSSPPKFRPPSPMTHQQQQQQQHVASSYEDNYARHSHSHYFHHYHPQMSASASPSPSSYKMQYPQQQQQQQQQLQLAQQMQSQGPPVVLRWVMEYDKSKK